MKNHHTMTSRSRDTTLLAKTYDLKSAAGSTSVSLGVSSGSGSADWARGRQDAQQVLSWQGPAAGGAGGGALGGSGAGSVGNAQSDFQISLDPVLRPVGQREPGLDPTEFCILSWSAMAPPKWGAWLASWKGKRKHNKAPFNRGCWDLGPNTNCGQIGLNGNAYTCNVGCDLWDLWISLMNTCIPQGAKTKRWLQQIAMKPDILTMGCKVLDRCMVFQSTHDMNNDIFQMNNDIKAPIRINQIKNRIKNSFVRLQALAWYHHVAPRLHREICQRHAVPRTALLFLLTGWVFPRGWVYQKNQNKSEFSRAFSCSIVLVAICNGKPMDVSFLQVSDLTDHRKSKIDIKEYHFSSENPSHTPNPKRVMSNRLKWDHQTSQIT